MPNDLLLAVPNLSEGRDGPALGALLAGVTANAAVHLLDVSADADHNRAVFTLVAEPGKLVAALYELIEDALRRLDLSGHEGVHPRFGVVDVVPFVPLGRTRMESAVQAALTLAHQVGDGLGFPVVLYGAAAREAGRTSLPAARRILRRAIETKDLSDAVDEGPRRAHPTGGVVMVGARHPLIAFNVMLRTTDVAMARRIASRVRESNEGLPAVRALGVDLSSRHAVQVTMNLTDPGRTPPAAALEAVEREARGLGVEVQSAEIVGLLSEAAAAGLEKSGVPIEGGLESRLLEPRLRRLGLGE